MLERLCQDSDGSWSTLPPTANPHLVFTITITGAMSEITPSSRGSGLHLPSHQDAQDEGTQLTPLDSLDLF